MREQPCDFCIGALQLGFGHILHDFSIVADDRLACSFLSVATLIKPCAIRYSVSGFGVWARPRRRENMWRSLQVHGVFGVFSVFSISTASYPSYCRQVSPSCQGTLWSKQARELQAMQMTTGPLLPSCICPESQLKHHMKSGCAETEWRSVKYSWLARVSLFLTSLGLNLTV